ncbi:butyrophilin subfamily 1 member A1-like [Esox lucius]|uniref:Ig-like domain-containing protein n=1 Tax=Esox lucius TaxID=8010 RepID=A0AAY5JVJ8_ESOLU|nr:butyrophilin subfamily 1 member A1-like [Esox lucius]XP_034146645.1 butyrophilin subfamily 1 member A1-like [Esox lucius]
MEDYRLAVICLLTLLSVCSAQYDVQVVGQSEPVVAIVGDDVILPCSLRTTIRTVGAVDESVEWQRPDLHPKEVHFYRSREDYNDDQNNNYRGRTSLFYEEMKNGNISLKLTGVKLSDAGNYTCFVPTLKSLDQKDSVQLVVASKPQVTIVGVEDLGVVLKCEAGGLMYRPEMTWLDSDGNILPDGPTETETDSEGHYTVRRHVTIQKTDNNTFTCRVQQQKINRKMETEIHVPDRMFPEPCQSWWRAWGFGGLTWGLFVLIVVVVVLYILNRKALLHWRRGELNEDPQINRTSLQNEIPLLNGNSNGNGNALSNGNRQNGFLPRDVEAGV